MMNNQLLTATREMVVAVLYDEPIEVLTAADHPLAEYEHVPWSELIHYPQVVFKDGYGMQRLVQDSFERLDATLQAALEVNTLDAFRGVVRQGGFVALLPRSALVEARNDPSLAVRPLASDSNIALPDGCSLTRQVVMITTQDRLQIPPIQHFWELVQENIPPQLDSLQQS